MALDACCGPFVREGLAAPTAEALMRSRYTAYVLGEIDHLVRTHDPATRTAVDPRAIAEWAERAEWRGLEVHQTERGGENDTAGFVEFSAFYVEGGVPRVLRERSRFRRIEGRWFYSSGAVPVSTGVKAPGRNDPCPCGSGRKYKKCCGATR